MVLSIKLYHFLQVLFFFWSAVMFKFVKLFNNLYDLQNTIRSVIEDENLSKYVYLVGEFVIS